MVPLSRTGETLKLESKEAQDATEEGESQMSDEPYVSAFVCHLLAEGYDIRTVQELLGHKDVRTTMIYTHVLNRGGRGVRSQRTDWSER